MCGICGCDDEHPVYTHDHEHAQILHVEQDLFAKNNEYATFNRRFFLENHITAINIMSSPGSGKTTLLARTNADLQAQLNLAVVVADQQTDYDAEKLRACGAKAVQINTGKVCHIDAHMLGHALVKLSIPKQSLLFIENVGNLVCPALFDLGEAFKIVLLSVTEGDNKPLKYPEMFHRADLMIVTKIDLLPYVDFDIDKCIEYAKRINPAIQSLTLSTTVGTGLTAWYQWLNATAINV